MRRVISVWLPTLPTDRIRKRNGFPPETVPLVTVARSNNARVIAAVDQAAFRQGVRPGMGLEDARVRVSGLTTRNADPAGDAEALERLAEWCLRYAPLAAVDLPDGLWIDITGAAHLHGGETSLLRDLMRRLHAQGLAARAAVADRPAIAHAVARFGADPVSVVPPGTPNLNHFPIEALRLPHDIVVALRQLGFRRIDLLENAPRAPLTRRFGPILVARLDQVAGRVFEPIVPIVPEQRIQASRTFTEPLLTAASFSAVIATLAAEVCTRLAQAGLGARRLDLLFERVDGSIATIRAGTARPVRDAQHLGSLLDEKLEQLDPGLGVEAMHLVVADSEPLGAVQSAASLTHSDVMSAAQGDGRHARETNNAPPSIVLLVDRLANRLGRQRVYRCEPSISLVPERSVRRTDAMAPARGETWPPDWPRPVRILHPPQPIEAEARPPHDPPTSFVWRRIRHQVRHADGPERIIGEWWRHMRESMAIRDYYRIEDETGRRFWLFRRDNIRLGTGSIGWFLQGFF